MTHQEPAPINHIISPKGLGERSYGMIQRCFIHLQANPSFKNALVGAFNGGSRGEVQISSDESGLSSSVWFEFGDYNYKVLYSVGEEIRDDQVLRVENLSFAKYEKASFNPNNVDDSPNIFFDLETEYEQHGDEKKYVSGAIIVGESKKRESLVDSEEAFQKIPELFSEIFPKPLNI